MSRAPNKAAARVGARALRAQFNEQRSRPGRALRLLRRVHRVPRFYSCRLLLPGRRSGWLHDEVRRGPPSRASFSFAALEAVVFFTVPS